MKILVLGGTGFVGRNIAESLSSSLVTYRSSRAQSREMVYFDLTDAQSWKRVVEINPDIIVNAIAYGVIKHETDLDVMYKINYFLISDFYNFLQVNNCKPFWFQLGTAFEYDLSIVGGITESSPCLPRTHYGISKLMFSEFLLANSKKRSCVLRPFGMFGKYEDESKFFPMLIKAQCSREALRLSSGVQKRDYIFVKDIAHFINKMIASYKFYDLPPVLNLGAGVAKSLKDYATQLCASITDFDPALWQWGAIEVRANESSEFYNSSSLASGLGFEKTNLEKAFAETVHYYCQNDDAKK